MTSRLGTGKSLTFFYSVSLSLSFYVTGIVYLVFIYTSRKKWIGCTCVTVRKQNGASVYQGQFRTKLKPLLTCILPLVAINAYPLAALLQIFLSHSDTAISFQALFALLRMDEFKLSVFFQSSSCTAIEGPVGIQYRCMVLIYVFPEMKLLFPKQNYNVLSPRSYIHICERFICFQDRLFCCLEIYGPILGICKSLTDTWMWKLGLRPRNSQKRNT